MAHGMDDILVIINICNESEGVVEIRTSKAMGNSMD